MTTATTTTAAGSAPYRARPLPVLRRMLAESWRSTLGWTLGLTAVLGLYLPLYPSMNTTQMSEVMDSLPPELIRTLGYEQITSGPGYAQATFFGLIGFVLLTIAAVSWGSSAIAGAEESGRLELTLAHGVSRVQYAVEVSLSIIVRLVALGAYAGLLIALLNGPSELDLEPAKVVAAEAALIGLVLVSAGAALAAGAFAGRRVVGTVAGAVVAAVGYVFNAIGNQDPELEWLHQLSPYDWAFGASPLRDGVDGGGLALLYGFSLLALVLAVIGLQRRDVVG